MQALVVIAFECALDALVYGTRRELKRSLSLVLAISMTKFCRSKQIHFQHLDRARNVTMNFKCNVLCWLALDLQLKSVYLGV